MKAIFVAATITAMAATGAAAEGMAGDQRPIVVTGYGEYYTDAEAVEIGAGVKVGLVDGITVTPTLVFTGSSVSDMDLNEIDVVATVDLTDTIAMRGVFTLDDELEYKETRIGAVFDTGYGVEFTPELSMDNDFEVQSLRLTAGYSITENVGLYARVETDDEYSYSETAVGVTFNF